MISGKPACLLTLYFYFYRICSMKIDFFKSITNDFYGYSFLSGLYQREKGQRVLTYQVVVSIRHITTAKINWARSSILSDPEEFNFFLFLNFIKFMMIRRYN
jgi:hypothetical protein